MNIQDDTRADLSAAEILTVAVLSAKYFQNHHEQALGILWRLGYIGKFSVSRFNRRLHALLENLWHLTCWIGELFNETSLYIIDAFPLPACKNIRRHRCRKVQGDAYNGYCAAKQEYFFGWHLHLVCDAHGIPVAFELNPAKWDELSFPFNTCWQTYLRVVRLLPTKATSVIPTNCWLICMDRVASLPSNAVTCAGIVLKMQSLSLNIATPLKPSKANLNSQLERMGLQRLHARTNAGIALKTLASLVALAFTNFIN